MHAKLPVSNHHTSSSTYSLAIASFGGQEYPNWPAGQHPASLASSATHYLNGAAPPTSLPAVAPLLAPVYLCTSAHLCPPPPSAGISTVGRRPHLRSADRRPPEIAATRSAAAQPAHMSRGSWAIALRDSPRQLLELGPRRQFERGLLVSTHLARCERGLRGLINQFYPYMLCLSRSRSSVSRLCCPGWRASWFRQ